MNISAVNLKLRKYLKKTGDGVSKSDEEVLDIIEKVFGLEASFLVMPDRNPNSNQTVVSIDMSLKGKPWFFNSSQWQYNAGTIRTGAHNLVCALGAGVTISWKKEKILIEIPPFKSAAELKMKLQLMGKLV